METTALPRACAVVGRGRLGTALGGALRAAGVSVDGPLGRGEAPRADVVLLCVPDGAIASAAAGIAPREGLLVGHCSGATTLAPLAPHEAFSLHPLMTVHSGTTFAGVPAAVAGSSPHAVATARALAAALTLRPFTVADKDRAAYHAAASVASNFLVTLEAFAGRLAATAGIDRALLEPLAHAALENWAARGPERALTGPVARGDEETIERQRAAVAERTPGDLALFDALVAATRELASRPDQGRVAA